MAVHERRCRLWTATINGTLDQCKDWIVNLADVGSVHGVAQIELAPATGQPHIQAAFYWANAVKGRVVLDKLAPLTGGQRVAHIEAGKGTWQQNVAYCTKKDGTEYVPAVGDETIVSITWGDVANEPAQGKRSDLKDMHASLREHLAAGSTSNAAIAAVAQEHGPAFIQYSRGIRELAEILATPPAVPPPAVWRQWQTDVLDHMSREVSHDRAIFWCWGAAGGEGKSTVVKELISVKKGCLLEGSLSNMAFAWKEDHRVAVFDISRTHGKLGDVIEFAEKLKNGMFFSSKYASTQKRFPIPHVIFFANEAPPAEAWTGDRLVEIKVSRTLPAQWNYGTCTVAKHAGYVAEAEDPYAQ